MTALFFGKRVTALCLILAKVLSFTAYSSDKNDSENIAPSTVYSEKLFDTSYVHIVNVEISDGDWIDLKDNPTQKTKYTVNIEIDGEKFETVSFSTKGNSSLTAVAEDPDSDRYSFKVNFGKEIENQTYYGLDKLNLNNIYADATYMKDYISYEIFRAAGVPAPLTSYVWLTVNGEELGLYLAIEAVDCSFLERNGLTNSELYKPESDELDNVVEGGAEQEQESQMNNPGLQTPPANQDGSSMTPPQFNNDDDAMPRIPSDGEKPDMRKDGTIPSPGEVPNMGGGMPNGNADMAPGTNGNDAGASLKYTDDELDSYSDIFDNAETDVTDDDKMQVISSLKILSEYLDGTLSTNELENAVDTDAVIRYFVAHNFVLNYDSYTGNMLHNYYLEETDGKLSILPWDYNFAFGAFSGGGMPNGGQGNFDVTSLINTGIDTPLNGTQESDRPMWAFITSNNKYLGEYHNVYNELLSSYFESGECEEEINRVYNLIHEYIERDNAGFYTVNEFDTAIESLKLYCKLRAESVRVQLDGTLSTKTEEQDDSAKIDASSLSIKSMGTHNQESENAAMP